MNRRGFLAGAGKTLLVLANAALERKREPRDVVTLFLCGDVMTGRGVDQVLPHPSDPRIHESYVKSALGYVELAETANGPIPRPVDFSYIWGDAIEELESVGPDVRIINLETSVTTSEVWTAKGINYRMHPRNIPCITVAKIDCCVLGNNHILDWGHSGLAETLETLRKAQLKTAGAGRDIEEAEEPTLIELDAERRVVVFSFGSVTSGIPEVWAASQVRPGVNLLKDFSDRTVGLIADRVRAVKRLGDIVVASIHWGGNWGYGIPREHSVFAHRILDEARVDVVHGHSSHHPKAIEIYKEKPILYGCGDFLNDYEGIRGHEEFRGDLVLMYFVSMDPVSGKLLRFEMIPLRIQRFKLNRVSREDAQWLRDTLNREGAKRGTRVELKADHSLTLRWG